MRLDDGRPMHYACGAYYHPEPAIRSGAIYRWFIQTGYFNRDEDGKPALNEDYCHSCRSKLSSCFCGHPIRMEWLLGQSVKDKTDS